MPRHRTPSLAEPEATGGDNAGRGLTFQEAILLKNLPSWLAREGFISFIHEAIGDIESAFYYPGSGITREFWEVKNHTPTAGLFWKEIERFYQVDQGSPGTYSRFTLVVPEIAKAIKPVLNDLRRIRSSQSFYEATSGVIRNSKEQYYQRVSGLGQSREIADFFFTHVEIETGVGVEHQSEGLFRQAFGKLLPYYRNLPYDVVTSIYIALRSLVRPHNTPITRRDVEVTILANIPQHQNPHIPPTKIYTTHQRADQASTELWLDWSGFWEKKVIAQLTPQQWDEGVLQQLQTVRDFIITHRNNRCVCVRGNRRLSATLALGATFSATGGFAVQMEYRDGVWWDTREQTQLEVKPELLIVAPVHQGEELAVAIGLPRDISSAVCNFMTDNNMNIPLLSITFPEPLTSVWQANTVVEQIKTVILQSISRTRAKKIHLFCAIPSFIALLLGHRLNATAPVQCYEYVEPNKYVPTLTLFP